MSSSQPRDTKRKRRQNRAKKKVSLKLTIPPRGDDESKWFNEDKHEIFYSDLDIQKRSKLGSGSSSTVIKVYYKKKPYALKIIPYGIKIKPQTILREIKNMRRLNCGYITRIFEAFHIKGSIRILLEYVDCGSITDVLKVVGVIPENILSLLSFQLLKGLEYLHSKKIIHRDIKPGNILINHKGRVKISDFGLSRKLSNNEIAFNSFKGTFCYMSPERLLGKEYDFNSDIWSLGLTLLNCLKGSFPFDLTKLDHFSYLYFLKEEMVGVNWQKEMSPEFEEFFRKCTIYDQEKRPNAPDLLNTDFIKKHYTDDYQKKIESWLRVNYIAKRKIKKKVKKDA